MPALNGKTVKVGTCGFSRSRKLVFRDLDVVEIQQTFYDPRDHGFLERIRREAPSGFEFTVKAWMLVTHRRNRKLWSRLREPVPGDHDNYGFFADTQEVEWAWQETVKAARIVGARIIVLQSPASFRPTEENLEALVRFVERHSGDGFVLAWEPRGEWWTRRDLLGEIALRLGVVIVGDFLRGRTPPEAQELAYTRLHGLGGEEVNYRYKYTREDLENLASIIRGLPQETVYVLFNNVYSYADAVEFKKMIEGAETL